MTMVNTILIIMVMTTIMVSDYNYKINPNNSDNNIHDTVIILTMAITSINLVMIVVKSTTIVIIVVTIIL